MGSELFEIKKNNQGYGILIERDSGFIDLNDERNIETREQLNKIGSKEPGVKIVDRLKVFCVFQKFGIENANGRIYPEKILRSQVELFQEKIIDRRSYGESNHPESINLDLDRLAFGITKLWWENKTLVGEIEMILTPGFVNYGIASVKGDILANYLRLGWKIGVSSRGLGSVEQDKFTGKYIVQDDFEITCWDAVCDPSTTNAWISSELNGLKPYIESKQNNKGKIIEGLDCFLGTKSIL